MFALLENIIEALYVYQQSFYYKLHFLLILIVICVILWLFVYERRIKNMEENPVNSKCSDKMEYFQYVTTKQKATEQAVKKLQESEEYQRYLMEKSNPNSKYNRRVQEDDDEIVLSDDSDEEVAKKYQ